MATTTPSRSTGKPKTNILLVDDHPIVRKGIAELLNAEPDLAVCGEAGTMQEAMSAAGQLKPDLMIIDVSLNGNNGIELMKNLVARWEGLRIIAYSMHDETIYAERSLRAGAKGYVMKHSSSEALVEAIREVLKGRVYLSEAMSSRMLGKLVGAGNTSAVAASPVEKLSDRELEVLEMLGKGLGTSQIADKLCLSVKTIETYREHLKQKLDLASGQELLRYAIEWSLNQAK